MRLDRLLVSRAFGSRREVGKLVKRGRVQVGDEVVRDPSRHLSEDAVLVVDGTTSALPPTLLAWHKPVGVLTTRDDPWGREGLDEALPPDLPAPYHAVGRLDQDTSGLLLLSRDGQLTQRLLHPKREVPRTYRATVARVPDGLADRVAAGVETADGVMRGDLEVLGPDAVRITVREGKHRMVRRMLHNAGASVVALYREAYGPVVLGDLAPGAWREVTAPEWAQMP